MRVCVFKSKSTKRLCSMYNVILNHNSDLCMTILYPQNMDINALCCPIQNALIGHNR